MHAARSFLLLLFLNVSGTSGQFETNITFSPDSVPHGEVVVINCGFNIPLDSVGLISIELAADNQLYEYQPDTGGVIDEDYEDRIISDVVDEGFVQLEMVVDIATDTDTYYCIVIDDNFDTYLSTDHLFIELPLLQVTTDPGFFRHGDRVTVRCEFVPLPDNIWNRISLSMTATSTELLYSQNSYPDPGKTTLRYGNDAAMGYYEMMTATFTDSLVEGTLVANYLVHSGQNVTCSLTDFQGNISESSTEFNVFTDHYVTITPNPAVIGEEVEFRCSYGYFADYSANIYWTKDDVQILNINHWSAASTFTFDDMLTSVEGDGYYIFTKIATAEDAGFYGCFADTIVGNDVSYKYINLTVVEMDDMTTIGAAQDTGEENTLLLNISAEHVKKEERKIKSENIRKEAGLKTKT